MFNINTEIERQRIRRNRAIESFKQASVALSDDARSELKQVANWNPVEKVVQQHPWETCALAFGAGLAAPSLLKSRALDPAQPQRVVVEVRGSSAAPQNAPAPASSWIDQIMRAFTLFEAFRNGMAAPQQEGSGPRSRSVAEQEVTENDTPINGV